MKRIFQCIFIFALLCMPLVSEAITVTISEVDPLWIPKASSSTELSIAWVNVTISDIDPNRDQYRVIEIWLDASTLKGICCNSIAQDIVDIVGTDNSLKNAYNNSAGRDLIFRREENSQWIVVSHRTLRYQIPSENTPTKITLSVGVLSLDYGGSGKLYSNIYRVAGSRETPVFELGEGGNRKGYMLQEKVAGFQQIPRDKNKNDIADSWNNDYYSPAYALTGDTSLLRNFGNKEDNDASAGTNYTGDHITAFEEYRGFMTYPSNKPTLGTQKVKHTRTSPDSKDMFVVNEDSETQLYGTGVEHSRISQHLLPSTHVLQDGRINFNANNGLFAYSVKVVSTTAATSAQNPTYGSVERNGPPDANYVATIYTTQIALTEAAGDIGTVIRSTIGHELGHAAHIDHCPKSDVKDANGKDKGWGKICMMWPGYDAAQNTYASHHDPDYAMAQPVQDPQTPVELDENTGQPKPRKGTLSPFDGAYTANAGDSHTANFTAPAAYSSVYWYVKSPSDTSAYGTTIEIDQGDGSTTTADFTYTFPSGVSGVYQIMAYVYGSDNSVYEESYTVSVSLPTTSTEPQTSTGDTSTTPTVTTPVWSNIPSPIISPLGIVSV